MKKIIPFFLVAIISLLITACGSKSTVPSINFDHVMTVATSSDSIDCFAIDSTMAIPFDPNSISDGVVAEPVKILLFVKDTRCGKTILYSYTTRESIMGFGSTNFTLGHVDTAVLTSKLFGSRNRKTGVKHHFGGENKVVVLGDSDINLIFDEEDEAVRILEKLNLWKEVLNYEKTLPETHSI